ncbi:MAG: hypothetical protein RR425_05180 [Erysipelotrichales bacterium]
MFAKSLLSELRDEKNKYLNDDMTFSLAKIYTDMLSTLFVISLIMGFITILLNNSTTILYNIGFNELASFTLGNVAFIYCFRMIKEKVVPYYTSNPLMLIGIIYPAFFNAKIISLLFTSNLAISSIINMSVLVLSIIVYYFILNKYYLSKQNFKK